MLTEDNVVDLVSSWLLSTGFTIKHTSKGTARGDDIYAISSNGAELFIECKGSITRYGNHSDEWLNSAMAIFGAIVEIERKRPSAMHAIALPKTREYQEIFKDLDNFLAKSGVVMFWINHDGGIEIAGAPNKLFKSMPLRSSA